YTDGAIQEHEALRQQAQAVQEDAEAMTGEGGLYDRQAAFHDATARQQANQQEHHRLMRQEAEKRVAQAWGEVPDMEPGRVWRNSDSFARASGLLAAGIQGFLNPGGESQAINMMNRLVEND